jgi:hypothetical protein
MRLLLVLTVAAALTGAQVPQPPPAIAGRWRLVDPSVASEMIAADVLVTEGTAPPSIAIEHRFPTGVRTTRHVVSDVGGFGNVAVWKGRTLTMGMVIRGPATTGPAIAREESWTIAADDRVEVDITLRSIGAAQAPMPKPIRVSYRRVPLPLSVPPGQNLLDNVDADQGLMHWLRSGDAQVDSCAGNACFIVRSGGSFYQTVVLPQDVAGKYLVLIGSGTSQRINADGGITGLPYLYATIRNAEASRILGYLQGQQLRARPADPDEWVTMSGVFLMPAGSTTLQFELSQASARGVPHNGSAAGFDHLGVYVFGSESEARSFVAQWRGRDR